MADEKPDGPDLKDLGRGYAKYLRYSGLGIQIVVYVVGGILLGRWLDGLIGWDFPVLTLVFLFLGMISTFWVLFKEVRRQR